jgi:esterase/lipase superfamily enzyme
MADMNRGLSLARLTLVLLALVTLAACSRPAVTGLSEPVGNAAIQRLYVATMRTHTQTGPIFGEKRSAKMNYSTLDISIPPGHVPGQVERDSGVVDPRKFFAPVGFDNMQGVGEFTSALKRHRGGTGAVMIFVHGYNNTLEDAAFRLAQIRQDLQLEDPAILFSWPSAGDPRGYIYDRDSVMFARDDFEQLIRDLRASGQNNIFIMAHSMGGYLTMEMLRQIALKGDRHVFDAIEGVALMSPDIDPDVFRSQAEEIGQLPQPFVIMTSREDKVLGLASLLTGRKPRLGRIEDESAVAGLGVTLIDFSRFGEGEAGGHIAPVSSPGALAVLKGLEGQLRSGRGKFRDFALEGHNPRLVTAAVTQ